MGYVGGAASLPKNYHASQMMNYQGSAPARNQLAQSWYTPPGIDYSQRRVKPPKQGRAKTTANYGVQYDPNATGGVTLSGGLTGAASGGATGTQSNPFTYSTSIEPKEIWNAEQIQNQVNQNNADITARQKNSQRGMAEKLSARGYGAGSGLGAALEAAFMAQGSADMMRGENDLRWGAAKANAEQLLSGQNARANEGLGLASLLTRKYEADKAADARNANLMFDMLSSMIGMV